VSDSIRNVDQKALESHGETDLKRKERSDKDSSIFTCQEKAKKELHGLVGIQKIDEQKESRQDVDSN